MTLEEAIKILSELHDQCCQADSIFCTDTTGARCEAVDMAISALQAQDVPDTNVGKIDRYGYIGIETLLNFCDNSKYHAVAVTPNDFMRMKRVRMPEPCEDAVSRKDVQSIAERSDWFESSDSFNDFMWALYELPPVTPKRNTGQWIKKMRVTETEKYTSYDPDWYCACCGAKYDPHIARMVNFCYVCGADMRGEQDGKST